MECCFPWLSLFDVEGEPRRDRALALKERAKPSPERRLLCAECGHMITRPEEAVAVNGAHEHVFTNPVGLRFHIGCFRTAPGCSDVGELTLEHTWFPGHRWCIALCAQCRAHLGWRFEGETAFYGLVLVRLRAAP